jgi:hypothetical protein
MTLSRQTQVRLPKIQKALFQEKTMQEIAEICKVSDKTIDRDMKAWIDSGEFELWLKEEWLRVYIDIKKIKPIIAFEALNNLVGKMLTRKIERKEQIELSQKVEVNVTSNLQQYESLITEELNRTLHVNSVAKQVDPAPTAPKTSPVPTA